MKTISVTQDDIDNGTKGDNGNCPVNRAAQRELGYPTQTSELAIQGAPDGTDDYKSNWRLSLPQIARQFMQNFDAGRLTEPFSFNLAIPALALMFAMLLGSSAQALDLISDWGYSSVYIYRPGYSPNYQHESDSDSGSGNTNAFVQDVYLNHHVDAESSASDGSDKVSAEMDVDMGTSLPPDQTGSTYHTATFKNSSPTQTKTVNGVLSFDVDWFEHTAAPSNDPWDLIWGSQEVFDGYATIQAPSTTYKLSWASYGGGVVSWKLTANGSQIDSGITLGSAVVKSIPSFDLVPFQTCTTYVYINTGVPQEGLGPEARSANCTADADLN